MCLLSLYLSLPLSLLQVWIGTTAPQMVRQQELQLRELLTGMAPGPHRLDVGFLSHELCLSKNQRKVSNQLSLFES